MPGLACIVPSAQYLVDLLKQSTPQRLSQDNNSFSFCLKLWVVKKDNLSLCDAQGRGYGSSKCACCFALISAPDVKSNTTQGAAGELNPPYRHSGELHSTLCKFLDC
ncbi:hypothetical protein POM88_007676 [Heracleum sosnowskyi]|uniref:Uncharacterized protein n=1 Tax=Heracleum sosnowskyi TaxID=360622 RepID=A0AAD8J799_9APIA|nr:hypothetical protein POM88_007676 [Heracleum sosnowskyi]